LERNIAGIQYDMNEKQRRWLLANALAHKKANKSAALQKLIGTSKQASRKAIALAYIMIKFGNLWSKPNIIKVF